MIKRLFLLLVSVLALTPSANSQLLYKIEGNGLAQPSYIFGTHHFLPADKIESPQFREIISSTGCIVGEMNMADNSQMSIALRIAPKMAAPADSTLTKVIADSVFTTISSKFTEVTGMPLTMFDKMRPMVANNVVTQAVMTMVSPEGISEVQPDTYIQKIGKDQGAAIVGLEEPEEQAEMLFGSLTIAQQAEQLVESLSDTDTLIEHSRELNDYYIKGDLEGLYTLSMSEGESDFLDLLLTQRNHRWLPKLESTITRVPSFIAVGALHLCGPDGLLTLLSEKGYTITPITDL